MNCIEHLGEPDRLFLSWQKPMVGAERRTRRIVGEIVRESNGPIFRYLSEREDFAKAQEEGFQGFPSFDPGKAREYKAGVIEAFSRRLPPRKRDDFGEYLAQYRLPANFSGSDMALLAYTGAKLPGDGFEIIPDLTGIAPPLEFVIEVAGLRHQDISSATLQVGDQVHFSPETDNPVDTEAIAVVHALGRIGYVPKPYCAAVSGWLENHSVIATVERLNGKPERPLVYLFVRVT